MLVTWRDGRLISLSDKFNENDSSSDIFSGFQPLFAPLIEPNEPIEIPGRGKYSHRNTLNNLTGVEWIKFTRSWFEHHPPPRNKKMKEHLHPAKFPEDLIAKFIQFFTKEGQWVLDPFVGTASTLVACDMTHRNGIGIELIDKWAKIATTRTSQYIILGDARDLTQFNLPLIHFCISSPPYWDMLDHSRGGSASTQKARIKNGFDAKFSEDTRDLGNIAEYNAFLSHLLEIYKQVLQILRPGGYIAVVLQNQLKENQQFYPIAWDFALKMRDYGWQLCQEFLWCQRDKKLNIWGYPNTYVSNVHHHYFLIFRKPVSLHKKNAKTKK